ncbi:metallophosphoesterase [Pseudomonas frederiksbergensis]|uniref:Serine/threonine protein phosphatase n=1 Tax=Pseudomonas frederiksbergensis TaxID=104087 RepID=A0A0B1Z763_9PSED|nr:metallophosphoesterase [Pseudomonas frederiksbergensis]KHK66440.1 serine/threonine protein phosphatase [Pseudomonas frederiksbergensis]
MKIQIYSDLHLEFSAFEPPATDADLVVLAGDIGVLARGVKWANATFARPVIYCSGNHEFYKGNLDRTLAKMSDLAAPHVHVMENQVRVFGSTRFLVATGWTDFTSTGDLVAATMTCAREMNDFRMIRTTAAYRRIRPADLIEKNRATYAWLDEQLSQPFPGATVVVTHHAPIEEVAGEKQDGHVSAAYFNRWYDLIPKANVWIFGHTHRAIDINLGGCRFVSNPRGYPQEATGFISDFTITV